VPSSFSDVTHCRTKQIAHLVVDLISMAIVSIVSDCPPTGLASHLNSSTQYFIIRRGNDIPLARSFISQGRHDSILPSKSMLTIFYVLGLGFFLLVSALNLMNATFWLVYGRNHLADKHMLNMSPAVAPVWVLGVSHSPWSSFSPTYW
jgi:hypothetical protein